MKKALTHLKKDPILKKVIEKHGGLDEIPLIENIFEDIVATIVGQQLSTKAANTIFERFKKLLKNNVTPKRILKTKDEDLRSVGISFAKIKYIKDLASKVNSLELDLENLKNQSDEEVMITLTKIKGIGPWTAQMILMFTLNREDVFSVGDLGLRSAISKLYNVKRDNFKKVEKISQNWKPYRSLASRYLWKSLDTKS